MARGRVVGKTDAIGATPVERPVSAKDVLATIYHLLGIDPHTTLMDRLNRPVPLVPYGDVVHEMLLPQSTCGNPTAFAVATLIQADAMCA